MSRFRAIWPITNLRHPITALTAQAAHDLPLLAAQAHCRITGPGRYSLALSTEVPGSGRVTEWVLIYEAPAIPTTARPYHPVLQAAS